MYREYRFSHVYIVYSKKVNVYKDKKCIASFTYKHTYNIYARITRKVERESEREKEVLTSFIPKTIVNKQIKKLCTILVGLEVNK